MSEVLEKHSRMPRKYDPEKQGQNPENGRFLPTVPEETRLAILEDTKHRIFGGERLMDIAAHHGIPPRTLDYWLAQLGDNYKQLRRAWLDSKLTSAEEMIADASDPLVLAKGRELFKCASWYAERRDPERYAPKQEITHKNDEPQTPEAIRERISTLEGKLGVRVINQEQKAA